uniref:Antennal binding protein n=1 Tax=Heliothis virescens TaxID=7102 RepID=A0A2A4K977_HELVI
MFRFCLLSFVVMIVSLESIHALSSDEESSIKEALHPFVVECAEEYGISEEMFEEAKKKGSAEDIDPCFMSCFLKKAEFFDGAGKFDVEKTMSFAKSHITSEPAIKFLEAAGGACVKINDEDVSDGDQGCDRAKLLFDCLMELKKKISE